MVRGARDSGYERVGVGVGALARAAGEEAADLLSEGRSADPAGPLSSAEAHMPTPTPAATVTANAVATTTRVRIACRAFFAGARRLC
jgi:hypothetical protein